MSIWACINQASAETELMVGAVQIGLITSRVE